MPLAPDLTYTRTSASPPSLTAIDCFSRPPACIAWHFGSAESFTFSAAGGVPSNEILPDTEPEPAAAAVPAGSAKVAIQFVADCWTQVTDGNGKVLFSAIKRKGDNLELTGKPPFSVRLGFARGAQVSYNGQAVDVAPFTSGETARLKLGQ